MAGVRRAVLAAMAIIGLALPGVSTAEAPPGAPTLTSQFAPCYPYSCTDAQVSPNTTDAQVSGDGRGVGGAESQLPSAENEHLADLFLLALLGSLVVIVPVIVTRQRAARDASYQTAKPAIRLVWSRAKRGRGD